MKQTVIESTNIPDEEKIRRLHECSFAPATYEKKFVRDMFGKLQQAKAEGRRLELSPKQEAYLDKVFYRYRKQLEKHK